MRFCRPSKPPTRRTDWAPSGAWPRRISGHEEGTYDEVTRSPPSLRPGITEAGRRAPAFFPLTGDPVMFSLGI